jgi:hypothetical protein
MGLPVREWTHWAAGYGLPRASLKLLARRGDALSQLLTININPVSDLYPLIEQVFAHGRMSPIERVGWASADAQIVREVLRAPGSPSRSLPRCWQSHAMTLAIFVKSPSRQRD